LSILRSSKSFQEDNREEAEEVGGLERVSTISFFGSFRGAYFSDISQIEKYTLLGSSPPPSTLFPSCCQAYQLANLNYKVLAREQFSSFSCQFGNFNHKALSGSKTAEIPT